MEVLGNVDQDFGNVDQNVGNVNNVTNVDQNDGRWQAESLEPSLEPG